MQISLGSGELERHSRWVSITLSWRYCPGVMWRSRDAGERDSGSTLQNVLCEPGLGRCHPSSIRSTCLLSAMSPSLVFSDKPGLDIPEWIVRMWVCECVCECVSEYVCGRERLERYQRQRWKERETEKDQESRGDLEWGVASSWPESTWSSILASTYAWDLRHESEDKIYRSCLQNMQLPIQALLTCFQRGRRSNEEAG